VKHLWDTHALIWAAEDDPQLSRRAAEIAAQPGNAISDISLWEVSCLVDRGRVTLRQPLEQWFEEIARRLVIVPIFPSVALKAYEFTDFHGDPADRLIAATAWVFDLPLITRDRKLNKVPSITTIWD
jgi:PIN domain nuclease of toxin-antitoxin system